MPDAKSKIRRDGLVVDLRFPEEQPKIWYGSPRPAYLRALLDPAAVMDATGVKEMPHDRTNVYYTALFKGEVMPDRAHGDDCILDADRPDLGAAAIVPPAAAAAGGVEGEDNIADQQSEPERDDDLDLDLVAELEKVMLDDNSFDEEDCEPAGAQGDGALEEIAAEDPWPDAHLEAALDDAGPAPPPVVGRDVERQDESHAWAGNKFYMTWRPDSGNFGAWQALCKYHKKNSTTACTRSMGCADASRAELDRVKRVLRAWCLTAPNHTRKREHAVEPLVVDMPSEVLEQSAAELPELPARVLDDVTLDTMAVAAVAALALPKAKAKALLAPKAKPKPKAKPAVKDKAKGKPKAKAKAKAAAHGASSASSSSDSSSSSSSSSSSDSS
jgi:hypothetical protein